MDSPIMLILGIGLLAAIVVFFALIAIVKILNSGIKHNRKIFLIILIIAVLVGAGVGFIFLIINIFLWSS